MPDAPSSRLRIGYLQVGPPAHGICRYGRFLAAAARRHGGAPVREQNLVLPGRPSEDRRLLRMAARDLTGVDLVHLQVSVWADETWGRGWHGIANLRRFSRYCRAPLFATLHDVNSLTGLNCGSQRGLALRAIAEPFKAALRPGIRLVKQVRRGRLELPDLFRELWRFEPRYPCLVAREAGRVARGIFVLTESEQNTLRSSGITRSAVRIPHFVEDLEARPAPTGCGGGGPKTVIVAGFIFGSKGHDLVLAAMPLMPDVKVVFLGGPRIGANSSPQDRLLEVARQRGVQDRLEVTGYLPDAEYLDRIERADLALCPFTADKSGSSSLATLISAGCPILASDIPPIAEFNAIAPGSIRTFRPYTAEALAGAVRVMLATPRATLVKSLAELRARLSLAAIHDQHVREYRRMLRGE